MAKNNIAKEVDSKTLTEALTKLENVDKQNLSGMKEIAFDVFATGKGIVNKNGNEKGVFWSSELSLLNNTVYPKGIKDKKNISRIFCSSTAVKEALFSKEKGLKNSEKVEHLLLSDMGLLNGYVVTTKAPANKASAAILTDFITDLSKFESLDVDNFNKLFKVKFEENEKKEILKNNGVVNYMCGTKTEENEGQRLINKENGKKSTSLYGYFKTKMDDVLYHSTGVFLLERLQFICTRAELGKQHTGDVFNEEQYAKDFAKIMTSYLKNKAEVFLAKSEQELSLLKQNRLFAILLEQLKRGKENINVSYGKYRYAGNLHQILNEKVVETGFKLNQEAMTLLVLIYFDLLLNTTVYRSNNAFLKVLNLNVKEEDLKLEEIKLEEIKFADFYIKVD